VGGSYRVKLNRVGRDEAGRRYVDLSIRDNGGRESQGVVSLTEIARDPGAVIRAAAGAGIIAVTPKRQRKLLHKIEAALDAADETDRVDFVVASKTGWHDRCFVTPQQLYGIGRSKIEPALTKVKRPNRWSTRGHLNGWRGLAAKAGKGNPLVIFAICAAFAPPLLALMRMEGAGIMLVGPTSRGKSTLSWLASSVWGGDPAFKTGFMDSWKATVGSLEEAAAQARDCLLVLDDTQQLAGGRGSRADTLAEAIFTLTSGVQKSRLTNDGQQLDWRLFFWATANFSARKTLADGGREYDDSIAARLIEVEANRRFGVFDRIPDGMDPAAFSKWIVEQSNFHYGHAIDLYLRRLGMKRYLDDADIIAWIRQRMGSLRSRLSIDGMVGLEDRVADIFGLIYAAGRLAQRFGIVSWSAEEMRDAIIEVYRSHRNFVAEDVVRSDPLAHVQNTIRRHSDSFIDLDVEAEIANLENAPGLVRRSKRNGPEFVFLPKQFHATFAGEFSVDTLLASLKRANLLICDTGTAKSSRKNQTKRHVGGRRERVYCIAGSVLEHGRRLLN